MIFPYSCNEQTVLRRNASYSVKDNIMKRSVFQRLTALSMIMLLLPLFSACGSTGAPAPSSASGDSVEITENQDGSRSCELYAMDTVMQFKAYGDNADKALRKCVDEIQRLDKELNVSNTNSTLYALNQRTTDTVSGDTAAILKESLRLAEASGGTFDPTIYPVVKAWGFTTQKFRVPDPSEIRELLPHIGFSKVSTAEEGDQMKVAFLDEQTELDTGGIGKGYASEKISSILKENGISSAIISLGGNVIALGSKTDGSKWKIAIENPFDANSGNYSGVLELSDKYAITSGGYQRYFEQDGQTYIHIMDPSTGAPVDNDLASVTIVSDSGTEGDALSTALYVMGLQNAAEFWKSSALSFEAVMITKDNQIYVTENIEDSFAAADPDTVHRISR